jgi:mono/diheme cytochrome c family protein
VEVDPDWVTPIFAEHCAGCHGGEAPDASLDLSGDVRAALVNVPSLQIDGPLVQPGDRMESYLWIKLEGRMALVDGYGTAMPPQGPLSQSERETLGGWIDAGAP